MLAKRVRPDRITGFDLRWRGALPGPGRSAERAGAGTGRPNDFAIWPRPSALSLYSASDAERVGGGQRALGAAPRHGPEQQRRLATVVVGGGAPPGSSW
jgi:hypothetical protein